MNLQRIQETCSCGATFDSGPCGLIDTARQYASEWRREHVCPLRARAEQVSDDE